MAEIGIRNYLNGKGIPDDQITYNNGNVMLKGKQFMSATPKADGSTYGDANALNQAYNSYNMNDALQTFKSNIEKPRAQFSYDPNSDQGYQSALQAAQRSAQTAGNNATVRLGSRGIGNSQQALTTENQIQQRSVADVNSNMLPQLIQQAYGRFHDNQVMDDQRNNDYLNLAGTYNNLGQQNFNNNRLVEADARQKQQDHINLANELTNTYGIKVDPKDDPTYAYKQVEGLTPLAMREYNDRRNDTLFEQDYKTRSLDNTIRNTDALITDRQADNQRQAASATASAAKKEAAAAKVGGNKVSTAQFNDLYSTLNQKYGVASYKTDSDGKVITDANGNPSVSYKNTQNPDQKSKVVLEVLGLGLSDDQTLSMLNKMGITEEEARSLLGG